MKEKRKTEIVSVRLWISRFMHCMFLFSFFLPFVAVQQCSTKEVVSYRGSELISGEHSILYLILIVLFFGYFIFSFFKPRVFKSLRAFLQSWKAFSAAGAGLLIAILPAYDHLFQKIFPQVGQILAFIACLVIYLNAMTESVLSLMRFGRETRKENPGLRFTKPMYAIHSIGLLVSCFLVLRYFIEDGGHFITSLIILLLTIPFLFSEIIALYSIKRGEKWTYAWSIVFLIGLCVSIFSYVRYISAYIIH